jgi:hypothetical protein
LLVVQRQCCWWCNDVGWQQRRQSPSAWGHEAPDLPPWMADQAPSSSVLCLGFAGGHVAGGPGCGMVMAACGRSWPAVFACGHPWLAVARLWPATVGRDRCLVQATGGGAVSASINFLLRCRSFFRATRWGCSGENLGDGAPKRASIFLLGAPLGSCSTCCMRCLWAKTLSTCGWASAAPLASRPPWRRRVLDLACSVIGGRRLCRMCGPFGGGSSSIAIVVAYICDEGKLLGEEVGRVPTRSIHSHSSGWNTLGYTTARILDMADFDA